MLLVNRAKLPGHQEFDPVPPKLIARVAGHLFRLSVGEDDPAFAVCNDDGIGHRIEDLPFRRPRDWRRSRSLLTLPQAARRRAVVAWCAVLYEPVAVSPRSASSHHVTQTTTGIAARIATTTATVRSITSSFAISVHAIAAAIEGMQT
jgi:hypothetical protein